MSTSQLTEVVCSEPGFKDALGLCVGALRRMSEYELDEAVNPRLQRLGERKEFLDEEEHSELMSLVKFSEQRSNEKLEARLALQRLGALLPELVEP